MLKEWKQFHKDGRADPGIVRAEILASWQRSRAHGVNPRDFARQSVSARELAAARERESELRSVSQPILTDIFGNMGWEKYTIVLASSQGIVLDVFSPTRGLQPFVEPGNLVRENVMGTSGTATCLHTGQPMRVFASEHYVEAFHDHVCIAEPIYGINKELSGAISITHHCSHFHSYAVALMHSAARNISEQLRLREQNAGQRRLFELLDTGIITISGLNNITGYTNAKALSMLGLPSIPENCALEQLFPGLPFLDKIKARQAFQNQEALLSPSGAARACPCTVSFVPTALNADGGVLLLRETAVMREYAARTVGAKASYRFEDIIGKSPEIMAAVHQAALASSSDITTLILGESGTGKELFAHSIHNAGSRRNRPFIAVNCGAIPRDLVQAELFGYAEGAFTGASRHGNPGKFELADGGTIFLDEIGEMTMEAQISLLRLLQEAEVTRVGGKHTRQVDVRIIAATNRDLASAVHHKTFREDLFYRLNAFTIQVPPLRSRTNDIAELALFFLNKLAGRHPEYRRKRFADKCLQALRGHSWPGNVRELENAVEYAVYVSQNDEIGAEDLPQRVSAFRPDARPAPEAPLAPALREEKDIIETALLRARGDVPRAAQLLRVSRSSLYRKIALHGLRAKNYRLLDGADAPARADSAIPSAMNEVINALGALPREKIGKLINFLDTL
ncbi:sigma 54-interacting transcriptional regulator [Desulfovibrio sp. OttesenSCG-928-C14]|nr:sigma 54-interacting transcriptional regulator [Desulfovibrio sp. OttesenSCG-928-C14]